MVTPNLPRLTGELESGGDHSAGAKATPFNWVSFALRAARKRKLAAFAVFALGSAFVVAFALTRQPDYRVYTTILAQRSQALPSTARPTFEDLPTRSAWEIIHRRENLIAIVKQAKLAETAETPQPPVTGIRAWLARVAQPWRAAAPPRDPTDTLVLALDDELKVMTHEGTITIQIDWPEPKQAHAIVQAALQNFLEARHVQEVTAIDEVLSVLQARSVTLRKELEDAIQDARKNPLPRAQSTPASTSRQPSEEVVRLQSLLASKQRAIEEVESFRRRRLSELDSQLHQSLNTLSEAHPTVIALRQEITAVSRESPQVELLREEERKLRTQVADRTAREGVPSGIIAPPMVEPARTPDEDPRVAEARRAYEQMNARVGATQVERDAARAAFKYRYNVVWPPQFPQNPYGGSRAEILFAGILASLTLAIAAAAAPDVLRGRVMQRWQVERSLQLPILGEFDRK